MKIGIFGGSFNPPHIGHILAAEKTVKALGLDKLIIIPAGDPPHKELPAETPTDKQRMELVTAAFAHIDVAEISDIELKRQGKSYTITTLEYFREIYSDDELFLLMGTDMFVTLDQWYQGDKILQSVVPAVFARKDFEYEIIEYKAKEYAKIYNAKCVIIDNDITVAASTDVRALLQNRQGRELLNDDVYDLVIRNRFYGAKPEFQWLRSKSYALHKTKRIPHVMGCEEEAAKLAARWGYDVDMAREAGILHDITKKLGLDEQLLLCSKYGILNDALESQSEKLLHSKTGAELSKDLFGIPKEIYTAIRWHTTGRADMTLLEKIIYLADYVEPNRDFEGVEPLRKLCYEDLDAAMELGLKMSIEDLEERGSPIHQKTLEAYEYYSKVKG